MKQGTLGCRLRERDFDILREVSLHRVLRRDDLINLGFFKSISRCNHRMSQLVRAGLLRRVYGINGLERHESIYGLGRSAGPLLERFTGIGQASPRGQSTCESPLALEHSLRILDYRHKVIKGCTENGLQLREWLAEPECYHEFEYSPGPSMPWKSVSIKPDACFKLAKASQSARFFLEIDLGHVSLPRFGEKLRRYAVYLQSGAYVEAYGDCNFGVVTVTTGARRLHHLQRLRVKSFEHLLTTWSDVQCEGAVNPTENTIGVLPTNEWLTFRAKAGGEPK